MEPTDSSAPSSSLSQTQSPNFNLDNVQPLFPLPARMLPDSRQNLRAVN